MIEMTQKTIVDSLSAFFKAADISLKPDYYGYLSGDNTPENFQGMDPALPSSIAIKEDLNRWCMGIEPRTLKHVDLEAKYSFNSLSPDPNIERLSHEVLCSLRDLETACIAVGAFEALTHLIKQGWGPYLFFEEITAEENPIYNIAKLGTEGISFLNSLSKQSYNLNRSSFFSDHNALIRALTDESAELVDYFLQDLRKQPISEPHTQQLISSFMGAVYDQDLSADFHAHLRQVIMKDPDFFVQGQADRVRFAAGGTSFGPPLNHGDLEVAECLLASSKAHIPAEALSSVAFSKKPRAAAELLVRYGAKINESHDSSDGSHALFSAALIGNPYDDHSLVHYFLELGMDPRAKNKYGETVIGITLIRWPLERIISTFQATPEDVLNSTSRSQYSGEGDISSMARHLDDDGRQVFWAGRDGSSGTADAGKKARKDATPGSKNANHSDLIQADDQALELLEFVQHEASFKSDTLFNQMLHRALMNGLPKTFSFLLQKAEELSLCIDYLKLIRQMGYTFLAEPKHQDLDHCFELLLKQPAVVSDSFLPAKQCVLNKLIHSAYLE